MRYFSSLFKKLFPARVPARPKRPFRRAAFQVEALEDRNLMAAYPLLANEIGAGLTTLENKIDQIAQTATTALPIINQPLGPYVGQVASAFFLKKHQIAQIVPRMSKCGP